ncbi:MAG: hypothetical protein ACI8ZO_001445 [Flavobacteriales bacterium]
MKGFLFLMEINECMKRIALLLLAIGLVFVACDKDGTIVSRNYAKQNTGESANDLLSDAKFDQLIVEIQFMVGQRPTTEGMDDFKDFLNARLRKSSGISFVYNSIPAQGKSVYTIDEIRAIENEERTQYNDGSTIAAYFLFVDGDFSRGGGSTLGVAYRNTSMCIFEKNITDNTGGVLQPPTNVLETTVLSHEFAHIMGLVDLGSQMQANHLDAANGKHCDVESCLMYYSVETTDVIENLSGGVPVLDAQCLADLQANGGK